MEVTFSLLYAENVLKEDIPALSGDVKLRVKKAIEEKLMTAPETYGKPLRRSLRGYRSLRVGDFRVVFRIDIVDRIVKVFFIGHRAHIYKRAY